MSFAATRTARASGAARRRQAMKEFDFRDESVGVRTAFKERFGRIEIVAARVMERR
jgi:hypothetical protein